MSIINSLLAPLLMLVSWKGLFQNLALLLAALIIMTLALEVGLRVTGVQVMFVQNPPIYRASDDPEISYELIPSRSARVYGATITTSALGFRSPELARNVRPIVLLGDSLVFGFGVQDQQIVGNQLQTFLSVPVLSAGVSGYNMQQERALFKKTLKPLDPRSLVLIFMWNDFDETLVLDAEGYLRPRSDRNGLTYEERVAQDVRKPGTLPIPFKGFLQRRSALFNFIERKTKMLPFRTHAPKRNIFDDPVTDAERAAYEAEFRRLTAAAGDIPKMLVIWPEENLHLATRRFLRSLGEGLGYVVVDLYEIFGNRFETLGWDGHPSAKTHRRTAEVLRDAMAASEGFRGSIPPASGTPE